MNPPIDLKAKFGHRYRITLESTWTDNNWPGKEADKPWYYEIVGKHGIIYPQSSSQLSLYVRGSRRFKAIHAAYPDWPVKRQGDGEAEFFITESDLPAAAKIIRARRRRLIPDDQKAALLARLLTPRQTPPNPPVRGGA